ncbi:hypothetical protein [Janibacter sp. G1551]|uniref:hypothetical protein n=1 Tax=Janibacter sp. G1551 TaxID=3420440 RepID=UPI003D0623F8
MSQPNEPQRPGHDADGVEAFDDLFDEASAPAPAPYFPFQQGYVPPTGAPAPGTAADETAADDATADDATGVDVRTDDSSADETTELPVTRGEADTKEHPVVPPAAPAAVSAAAPSTSAPDADPFGGSGDGPRPDIDALRYGVNPYAHQAAAAASTEATPPSGWAPATPAAVGAGQPPVGRGPRPTESRRGGPGSAVIMAAVVLLAGALVAASSLWFVNREADRDVASTPAATTPSTPGSDLPTEDDTQESPTEQSPTSTEPKDDASSSTGKTADRSGTVPAGAETCGASKRKGLKVAVGNGMTTCDFALRVRDAYADSAAAKTGGQVSVRAQSPVTGKTYTMSCSGDDVTTCTGGNDAVVLIY